MSDRHPSSTPPSTPQRTIGLTGGVGMGKTTVSNHLARVHQLPVLDADQLARKAVEAGSTVLQRIVERYGSSILCPDQTLDRLRLGEIVFNSPSERLWLEQQIHPYVRDRLSANLAELAAQNHTTAVVVVPLLFEAQMTDLVTEIWVVCCSIEQQIERMQQRDRLSFQQIQARIGSQMAIEEKMQQADVILNNDSTQEELIRQVDTALFGRLPESLRCSENLETNM
jgi:dephospho-CoA kinase